MIYLETPKQLRTARHLPFCYLCGQDFEKNDSLDRDHVPPRSAFNARDREPPLVLKTHRACNSSLSVDDKKIGQLIAMRRREGPTSARDSALRIVASGNTAAVTNLNVDVAIWRWVRAFHASLYQQPVVTSRYTLRTPFPRGDMFGTALVVQPILPQHLLVVEAIKKNRAWNNLDRIVTNKSKLRYECVWCLADNSPEWICMFGLDIYDWKDLGSHTDNIPARGCAGMYVLLDGSVPHDAARDQRSLVAPVNDDPLDPFGR